MYVLCFLQYLTDRDFNSLLSFKDKLGSFTINKFNEHNYNNQYAI